MPRKWEHVEIDDHVKKWILEGVKKAGSQRKFGGKMYTPDHPTLLKHSSF